LDRAVDRSLALLSGTFGRTLAYFTLLLTGYAFIRKRIAIATVTLGLTFVVLGTHLSAAAYSQASSFKKAIVSLALFEADAEQQAQVLRELMGQGLKLVIRDKAYHPSED